MERPLSFTTLVIVFSFIPPAGRAAFMRAATELSPLELQFRRPSGHSINYILSYIYNIAAGRQVEP